MTLVVLEKLQSITRTSLFMIMKNVEMDIDNLKCSQAILVCNFQLKEEGLVLILHSPSPLSQHQFCPSLLCPHPSLTVQFPCPRTICIVTLPTPNVFSAQISVSEMEETVSPKQWGDRKWRAYPFWRSSCGAQSTLWISAQLLLHSWSIPSLSGSLPGLLLWQQVGWIICLKGRMRMTPYGVCPPSHWLWPISAHILSFLLTHDVFHGKVSHT